MHKCIVFKLGKIPYDEALSFQFELVERVREKKGKENYLILLEHPPVITIGKNGNPRNIIVPEEVLTREGIIVRQIDRGGDVTYHGPGQLVGYPILNLPWLKKGLREYITGLEECLIQTVAEFALTAVRKSKYIGIWVGEHKIGFIGVRVSKGTTYHGFSLNINPNLNHFSYITPCGINGCKVGSLWELTDRRPTLPEVADGFIKQYCRIFDMEPLAVKTRLSYIPKTTNYIDGFNL